MADTASGPVSPRGNGVEPFDEHDYELARESRPLLYVQVTRGHVSLDHIAQAWRIRHDPSHPPEDDDWRVSEVLEYLARKRFAARHRQIEKDYWCARPFAGCALTGDGWIHSVMNTNDAELVLYEHGIHQLCRDAHRTFEKAATLKRSGRNPHLFTGAHASKKSAKDLDEVGQMLYGVLCRVIATAAVLEDDSAPTQRKDEALAAVRLEWQAVRTAVEALIQRQARFEYFQGVGVGALITIPSLVLFGWFAVHSSIDQFGRPSPFTAAVIGGAVGAVISVTQRMSANTLVLDFTAPKHQKVVLGALRPLVGAVFAAVVYFVFISGLLAVEARPAGEDVSAALAFFAVVGFAAGFSERFATDVLDRASWNVLAPAGNQQRVGPSDDPSMLLSKMPRRAETAGFIQDGQQPPGGPPRDTDAAAAGQAGRAVETEKGPTSRADSGSQPS